MRTESSARFYELMSISVPDGTPEELLETADAISGYVTSAGGRVIRTSNDSPWGRRRLAYPIRHNSADLRDGFYTLYHFEIQPEGIESIEREIRLNERIIRHLLLTLDSEPVFVEEEAAAEGEEVDGEKTNEEAAPAVAAAEAVDESAETAAPVETAPVPAVAAAPAEQVSEPVDNVVEVAASEEE